MIYDLYDKGHMGEKVIEGHALSMRLKCNANHEDRQLNIYLITIVIWMTIELLHC